MTITISSDQKRNLPGVAHETESALNPCGEHLMIAKFPTHDFSFGTELEKSHKSRIPSFKIFEKLLLGSFGSPRFLGVELGIGMSEDHVIKFAPLDGI